MRLGERINKAINEAGLKLEVVSGYADISVATLRRLLEKDSADTEQLIKISEITKKPLSYFLPQMVEEEQAPYHRKQKGDENQGHNIKLLARDSDTPSENPPINIEKLQYELALCQSAKASLEKEVALKDRIISMLEEKIK